MQVYKITPTISYSYGCALVAANNREEAIETYKNDYDDNPLYYQNYECVCDIVDKLTYDTDKPTVILDTIAAD